MINYVNSTVLQCALSSENVFFFGGGGGGEKLLQFISQVNTCLEKVSAFHLVYFYNFDPLIPDENLVKTLATLHSLLVSKV